MSSQALAYSEVDDLRAPPHSLEAERSILGGLMLDNAAWEKVVERVSETDFYRYDHRLIYRAMQQLASRNQPLDVITLSEALAEMGKLDDAGGLAFLIELAKNTPSAANVAAYADIVYERSILRQLISVGNEIADIGYAPKGKKPAELLDDAERKVFQIAEKGSRSSGPSTIKTLLAKAVERIDTLFHASSSITGLATGYHDFDEMTAGLQPSDLLIIAGRPSMGKTTFAMNLVENAIIKEKKPVLVFSLEMPGDQLAMRLLSSLGQIEQHRLRTGKLQDDDWPRFSSAVSILSETKLLVDDSPGMGPAEIRARARRASREHGELGLIVIDYLQLMTVPGSKENRTTEISEISRSLKLLAKELRVPVIALSQLNRELEHRPNKRPIMSDLRESGAIEQDADLIIFIYRDEVYNKESPEKGTAEIIIAKQRNGPTGTLRLTFRGEYCRFENFAYGGQEGGYY
jgi:replicative DNA helicase